MYRLAIGLLLFSLVSPAFSAKNPAPAAKADQAVQSVLTMKVDSLIRLDAAGALLEFRTETPMPDALRANLDKVVMRWRFKPTLADGVARPVTTRMRITLIATQDGKDYRVNVDNVIFPGDAAKAAAPTPAGTRDQVSGLKMVKPDYPLGLMRQGISGTVLLGLRVGADGRVADVVAVQSSLRDVKGRPNVLAEAIAQFEKSALTSARRWTFSVPASLANGPVRELTVNVPINYNADTPVDEKPGMWRTEVRTSRRQMSWLGDDANLQRTGVSDAYAGETLPVASAVQLETNVIGAVIL